MSHTISTRPRLSLTAEQEEIILQVLERNHAYYMARGMSRAHMWPEELLSELRNELVVASHAHHIQQSGRQRNRPDMTADSAINSIDPKH